MSPDLIALPAETIQVEHPMAHAFPLGWAVVLGFALGVVLTLVGVSAWAPAARDGAFVASPSSQQAVSTKGFNPLAGGRQ